jgi:hypothetical protein
MQKQILTVLGVLGMVCGIAVGQAPEPPPPSLPPTAVTPPPPFPPRPPPPPAGCSVPDIGPSVINPECCKGSRFWGSFDYLMWWFKAAPDPVPLVTSGSLADPVPGALGQPGTTILFGEHNLQSPMQSGYRLTLGGWLDDCRITGIEFSGFYFQPRDNVNFVANSNGSGLPVLGVPFFDVTPAGPKPGAGGWNGAAYQTGGPGSEAALLAANGTTLFGSIAVTSSTQLWGLELNGVVNLLRDDGFHLDALYGIRYIDLAESLGLEYEALPTSAPNAIYRAVSISDEFRTRNQFYGAQLGLRAAWNGDWWFTSISGKAALGGTHEVLEINGQFADSAPLVYKRYGNSNGLASGSGIFAQPSNVGRYTGGQFAVAGDLELKFGVKLTRNLSASIGYELLGLGNVIRPGDQIDRAINTTQAGAGPGGTAPNLTGPANPGPLFNQSNFWAQGLNFGLEWRF